MPWFLSDVCTPPPQSLRGTGGPETAGPRRRRTAESGAAASGWNPDEPVTNGPYCVSSRNARSLTPPNRRLRRQADGPEKLSFDSLLRGGAWALRAGTVALSRRCRGAVSGLEKEGKPATDTLRDGGRCCSTPGEVTNDQLVRRALVPGGGPHRPERGGGAAAVQAAAWCPTASGRREDTDFRESGENTSPAKRRVCGAARRPRLCCAIRFSSWNFPERAPLATGGTSAAVPRRW